jgi:hypothetical protein
LLVWAFPIGIGSGAKMKKLVEKIESFAGVRLNPPSSLNKIQAAEAQLGSELPQELKDFYSLCNGLTIERGVEIPSLEKALVYFRHVADPLFSTLLPVLDEDDSNPICMFHSGPLRGYVAHVFHDGDSHVRWRRFRALLEQIAESVSTGGGVDGEGLADELHPSTLTEHDFEAGRAMVEFAKTLELHSAESPMAYTFAFDLLGEGQVSEIAAFLEHEDMFVARAARDRLAELKSTKGNAALMNSEQELKRLKAQCAEFFRCAGRQVTIVGDDIRVDSIPLNWEAIYSQRRRPDFEQWVVNIGRRGPQQ